MTMNRAEELMEVFYQHYTALQPHSADYVCVAEIIRTLANQMCLHLGELEHPADVLNTIADEVESLNNHLTRHRPNVYNEVVHNNHYDRMETD